MKIQRQCKNVFRQPEIVMEPRGPECPPYNLTLAKHCFSRLTRFAWTRLAMTNNGSLKDLSKRYLNIIRFT